MTRKEPPTAYRCEATSVGGFLQQLGVCYAHRGYKFYIAGRIPEHKDVGEIDAKLIEQYDINVPKHKRAWRKKSGRANMQYLRYGRFFVLCATKGRHEFFQREAKIKDFARDPLEFGRHRLRLVGKRLEVVMNRQAFLELKAYLVDAGLHRRPEKLEPILKQELLYFEPFSGVRQDQRSILHAVNKARKKGGFETISGKWLPRARMALSPFEPLKW